MADALRVNVGERAEELVDVELNFEDWHRGFQLIKVTRSTIHGLGYKLQYQVQVYFIFLRCDQRGLHTHEIIEVANPVSVGVVEGLELDDVRVPDNAHDLEFSVLHRVSAT